MATETRHPPDALTREAASLFHLLGGMGSKHLVIVGGLVPPLLVPGAFSGMALSEQSHPAAVFAKDRRLVLRAVAVRCRVCEPHVSRTKVRINALVHDHLIVAPDRIAPGAPVRAGRAS